MPRPPDLAERIVRPLRDLFLRRFVARDDDPWEPVNAALQRFLFGDHIPEPFRTLPDGSSVVPVDSIDDICTWLQGCAYVSDREQFGREDLWQHPADFEKRRQGDCEDHALWAWRKMAALGHPSHFYLGKWLGNEEQPASHHAWVVFEWGGRPHLLETVIKRSRSMVFALEDVRDRYLPHFSFDAGYGVHMYTGFLHHLRERRLRDAPGAGAPVRAPSIRDGAGGGPIPGQTPPAEPELR